MNRVNLEDILLAALEEHALGEVMEILEGCCYMQNLGPDYKSWDRAGYEISSCRHVLTINGFHNLKTKHPIKSGLSIVMTTNPKAKKKDQP